MVDTSVIYTDALGDILEVNHRTAGISSIGIRAKRSGFAREISVKDEDIEKLLTDIVGAFGYTLMKAEKTNGTPPESDEA
jgi:hypothetical protein